MDQEKENKNRILVVDDEKMNLKAIKRLLKKSGFDLRFSQSGEDALETAADFVPDLVVLDVMMPGMNGYEVCKELKSNKKTADTLVLLLSGKNTLEDRLEGYKVNADDYITKPYDPEELKAKISILLRLKNTQKTLQQAVARAEFLAGKAEAASQAKSQFLTNISHEIMTPLNGVLGFTQMLMGTIENEKQKTYLADLNKCGTQLFSLINDLLDYSKLEAGEMLLSEDTFNPSHVIKDVFEEIREASETEMLQLECCDKTDQKHAVRGDQARFKRILVNLLSNAVKYTREGKIELRFETFQKAEGKVELCVRVTDTGAGISDEIRPFVFEPFSQGDGSLARNRQGTGLGLSLSKKLAAVMGGDIGFESTPGKGSVFLFTSVVEEVEKPDHQKSSDGKKSDGSAAHILIVEDNPVNQKVAGLMLKKSGFKVSFAGNGREGVDLFFKSPESYELILMDVQMPEMDGLQATEEIRRRGAEKIPIIALTAHNLKKDRDKCLDSGMNDYMTKPLKKDRLLEMVEKWVLRDR